MPDRRDRCSCKGMEGTAKTRVSYLRALPNCALASKLRMLH